MKNTLKSMMVLSTFVTGAAFSQCDVANLSVWSDVQNTDGALSVTGAAAMEGLCGLAANMSLANKNFVGDTSPTNEQRYRQAMCIDPNSIALPSSGQNRKFKFHNAQCTDGTCGNSGIVQFKLQNDGTTYQINGFVRDSNSNNNKNKWTVDLADAPNRVEYDVDLTAGTFKLWVDATADVDVPVINLSGLDMAAWNGGVSLARFGQANKSANVPTNTPIFIDSPESRRSSPINGTCTAP